MIKINGAEIPAPTDYTVSIMDIDGKTTRTASGRMTRDRIAVKRKIELTWKFLSKEELSGLLKKVSALFFKVSYIDPQHGGAASGSFYVGDRTAGGIVYNNNSIIWKDVKMSFIEQ